MRPPFNSFRPQARPHPPQQQHHQQQNNGYPNHHQHNGYQNPMNSQMMSNPMMGHMNNQMPMPNMPIHPQFFNNLPNMPQQQQQQLHQFAMPNQFNQLIPNLLGTLLANNNLMAHSLPLVQPNFFRPSLEPSAFTSQPQLNSFNPLSYPPVPNPHQNHQLPPPGFSEPRPRGQPVGIIHNTNGSGSKANHFQNKFTKHQKFKGPGQGFQRSQLHQADNAKRKHGFNKDRMGKGNYKKVATGLNESDADNKAKENKRSYALVYTSKEIQQWCEARRKNFPTKLNVEKKLKKSVPGRILDEEARMRRQQLQEVLAKQAELGVEVAEVPSYYLSKTDEKVNGDRGDNNGQSKTDEKVNGDRGDNNGQSQYKDGMKGRCQNNRYNKRRHDGKDKSAKKSRIQDESSSQESSITTRKPTLLEKLLGADIKRDKIQLLQVFRFMVINSLFKELPEQPLKLPVVMVEETGCEHLREEDLTTDVLCDESSDDDVDVDVDVKGDDDNSCDEDVDFD